MTEPLSEREHDDVWMRGYGQSPVSHDGYLALRLWDRVTELERENERLRAAMVMVIDDLADTCDCEEHLDAISEYRAALAGPEAAG